MLPCSWKETFGIDCPGCGAQRSLAELFRGNFLESLYLFPALIPLLITLVLSALIVFKLVKINPIWIARFFGLTAFLMFGAWLAKL